ncbi:hypothetical protein GCM10011404_21550 [Sphingomonas prati]|nr:hypothetical protein GCM10011404_21550 [Sphingomonas prati]
MDDAIAVALERITLAPRAALLFNMGTPAAGVRIGGVAGCHAAALPCPPAPVDP